MIRVSVMYPADDGATFDRDYWFDKHFPIAQRELGSSWVKPAEADICLDGGDGAGKPPYLAIAHMFFDSVESFQQAMAEKAGPVLADVRNYTNVNPELLVSEAREL